MTSVWQPAGSRRKRGRAVPLTQTKRTRKASGTLARFADAREQAHILDPVGRMLLARAQEPSERRQDVIHPSEMAKANWCPRATYYRLAGVVVAPEAAPFQLERIFQYGTDSHVKWQTWMRETGGLYGEWGCLVCKRRWMGESPDGCVSGSSCPGDWSTVTYREVPLCDPSHLIEGKSDGQYRGRLVEIKTVGTGTIRIEAPAMVARYTYPVARTAEVDGQKPPEFKYLDLDALWRDLRRPFASHRRQGQIYLYLRQLQDPSVDRITYLYESKATQHVKEFTIGYDPAVVEPLLDACKDIVYGLSKGRPPGCPSRGCKECSAYEGVLDGKADRTGSTGAGPGRPTGHREPGPVGEGRDRAATQAGGRDAPTTGRVVRRRRSGTDGDTRPVHSLGGLLGGATRDG